MTKKHFEFVAELLKNITDPAIRMKLVNRACEMFKAENPRFDKDRFLKACDL